MKCMIAAMGLILVSGSVWGQTAGHDTAKPEKPAQGVEKQPPAKTAQPTREELDDRWQASYAKKDYPAAIAALKELVKLAPGDPVVRYNLACVAAQSGDIDSAELALRKCLELGFTDFPRMMKEPDLKPVQEGVVFQALQQGWRELQDTGVDYRIEQFRKRLAAGGQSAQQRGYRFEKDNDLRMAFVSGFSKDGHEETKAELKRIVRYWETHVLPPQADGTPTAASVTQGSQPDPWVVIFLPNGVDYQAWAQATLGAKVNSIGGLYDNWKQQLVARDMGPTLRHEFWHALHWRHMSRIGQVHAMWVQEGLCSLIEDIDLTPADASKSGQDEVQPVASWRTNTCKRMVKTNLLPKLSALMSMDEKTYMGSRVLGNYAASRAFFLWLATQPEPQPAKTGDAPAGETPSRTLLRAWYAAYLADFATDPTGKTTTERILGKPLDKLDKDFRAWIVKLPDVGEANAPGIPTLPADLQPVGGEGMVVADTGTNDLLKNPLLVGDVIVSVDGHSVRDQTELARLLGGWNGLTFKHGQQVALKVRRDGRTIELKVKLND